MPEVTSPRSGVGHATTRDTSHAPTRGHARRCGSAEGARPHQPQPAGRRGVVAADASSAAAITARAGAAARRDRGAARGRRAQPRRDALRHARAVQPPRPHAAVHRRHARRRRAPRRRSACAIPTRACAAAARRACAAAASRSTSGVEARRLRRADRRVRQPGDPRPAAGDAQARRVVSTAASPRAPAPRAGSPARRRAQLVHRLRDEHDAVMVGAGTVLADDPQLTCRLARRPRSAARHRRRPAAHAARGAGRLADGGARAPIIATAVRSGRKLDALRRRGVAGPHAAGARTAQVSLRARCCAASRRRGVSSVLHRGRRRRWPRAALRARVVDRVLLFLAPKLIGGDGVPMIGPLGVRACRGARLRIARLAGRRDLLVRCRGVARTSARRCIARRGRRAWRPPPGRRGADKRDAPATLGAFHGVQPHRRRGRRHRGRPLRHPRRGRVGRVAALHGGRAGRRRTR